MKKKCPKMAMLKCWNHSKTTGNYAVTYYKTLEEIQWHLGLKELKQTKIVKKLEKIGKISIKLRVFSVRFFERRDVGGGGGGATARWGRGGGVEVIMGGATLRVSSTSTNSSSHHKYKSPIQFELKQSWKALRALNARWALPGYLFICFWGRKVKSVRRKSGQAKNCVEDRQD